MARRMESIHSEKSIKMRKMLRKERKDRKLRQIDVANAMGVYRTFVTKYEKGERRLDLAEFLAVAKAIGFDLHAFIDELGED